VKPFKYVAIDHEGRPVSGTVEAVDWQAAQELLVARGLGDCQLDAGALLPDTGPALSTSDAVELAGYLSELTKAGLPLGDAMRAMAKDLSSRRLSKALGALSKKLEAGHSLEAALESLGSRLPVHLRELIVAGARSGKLTHTLDRLLAHQREMNDMTGQFWQAVSYPAVLMVFLTGWLLFAALWLVPEMQVDSLLSEFGGNAANLDGPGQRLAEFTRVAPPLILGTLGAMLLLVGAVRVFGGTRQVSRLFAQLPLVGPAWQYRGLTELAGLLAVFVEQQIPLGEALRLTSLAARDPAVRAACRKAAEGVAAGRELSQCFEGPSFFPASFVNLIRWGERHGALADALRTAHDMFFDRFELQTQLARLIVPPIAFALIAASALFVASGVLGIMTTIEALMYWPPRPTTVPLGYYVQFSGLASVLVFGASLLAAARVLKTIATDTDASPALLRFTGWVLIVVGLSGACSFMPGGWGLLAWLIVMGLGIRGAMHYRAMQQRSLLGALTLAVSKQMPLAPLALAFADEQQGGFALRARELAQRLEAGASLAEAIKTSRGALPPEAALAAEVGADSGDLPAALHATTFHDAFDRALLRPVMLRLVYVFPVMFGYLLFMKLNIEPAMVKIFADFGTPLPPITSAVTGSKIVETAGLPLMIVLVGWTILAWLQWRGTLLPRLPGVKRIINWVDMGPVLRVLALATTHDRPMPQTLHAIARFHPKRSVRRRMRAAVQDCSRGMPWCDSLRRQRLLSSTDGAVLGAAQRTGNLPWAMREMAESFERRATFRLQALVQGVMPLLLLPVGLCAAVLITAYFVPLTTLIRSLC
jgi:general secretion pathway protein F